MQIAGGEMSDGMSLCFRFGATLLGISNTVATVPGIVAPIAAGALTPDVSIGQY